MFRHLCLAALGWVHWWVHVCDLAIGTGDKGEFKILAAFKLYLETPPT